MLKKGMHKKDVEEVLEGKGDFVKIDYLTRYLNDMPPIEMRKFAYLKLAEIHFGKGMFSDAARMFQNAAINSITFREKQKYYLKEAKSEILGGKYDESDRALKKALNEANSKEKEEIYSDILEFYKKELERSEMSRKPIQTIKIYEKLMGMKIDEDYKEEIKMKLIELYDQMGRRKEADFLRKE
jgi:tetratricopeptide (TPR) repeat protein